MLLPVVILILLGIVTEASNPAGSYKCAAGGIKRTTSGGTCACVGTVYYCAAAGCTSGYSSGSRACGSGSGGFGDPAYKQQKNCYCKPDGCKVGQKGPASSCTSCAAGQYQGNNQFTGTACFNCDAGTYSGTKATSCSNCPTGQYQGAAGQTYCYGCPLGQYQGSNGQISCNGACLSFSSRFCSSLLLISTIVSLNEFYYTCIFVALSY